MNVTFRLARSSQAFHVNIVLCEDEVVPGALVFGVLVPFVSYHIIKVGNNLIVTASE